jgi:hypothetical protein
MSAELHYKNDDFEVELDGNIYRADLDATAEYSYTPGRMYMPNGDPGYPPDEDFEIVDVDFVLFDGETEITDKELIERADAYITDWLYDNSDVFPPPEPPEPDWY